jgi:hypothetical protein
MNFVFAQAIRHRTGNKLPLGILPRATSIPELARCIE